MGILHNIVRHCNQSKLLIREENGIELLHNYYPTKFLIIKAHVMILLAYCINEEENEKIVTGDDNNDNKVMLDDAVFSLIKIF